MVIDNTFSTDDLIFKLFLDAVAMASSGTNNCDTEPKIDDGNKIIGRAIPRTKPYDESAIDDDPENFVSADGIIRFSTVRRDEVANRFAPIGIPILNSSLETPLTLSLPLKFRFFMSEL